MLLRQQSTVHVQQTVWSWSPPRKDAKEKVSVSLFLTRNSGKRSMQPLICKTNSVPVHPPFGRWMMTVLKTVIPRPDVVSDRVSTASRSMWTVRKWSILQKQTTCRICIRPAVTWTQMWHCKVVLKKVHSVFLIQIWIPMVWLSTMSSNVIHSA